MFDTAHGSQPYARFVGNSRTQAAPMSERVEGKSLRGVLSIAMGRGRVESSMLWRDSRGASIPMPSGGEEIMRTRREFAAAPYRRPWTSDARTGGEGGPRRKRPQASA